MFKKSAGTWKRGVEKGRRGPARKLPRTKVAALVPKLHGMMKKALGKYEVTAAMLKKSARVKVSTKTLMKRLREQEGVKWYTMQAKPT